MIGLGRSLQPDRLSSINLQDFFLLRFSFKNRIALFHQWDCELLTALLHTISTHFPFLDYNWKVDITIIIIRHQVKWMVITIKMAFAILFILESALNGTKCWTQRERTRSLFSLSLLYTQTRAYTSYNLSAWLTLLLLQLINWKSGTRQDEALITQQQHQKVSLIFKSSQLALECGSTPPPRRKKKLCPTTTTTTDAAYALITNEYTSRRFVSCRVVIITFTNDFQL